MWEAFPDSVPWHWWESLEGVPGALHETWMMLFGITGVCCLFSSPGIGNELESQPVGCQHLSNSFSRNKGISRLFSSLARFGEGEILGLFQCFFNVVWGVFLPGGDFANLSSGRKEKSVPTEQKNMETLSKNVWNFHPDWSHTFLVLSPTPGMCRQDVLRPIYWNCLVEKLHPMSNWIQLSQSDTTKVVSNGIKGADGLNSHQGIISFLECD